MERLVELGGGGGAGKQGFGGVGLEGAGGDLWEGPCEARRAWGWPAWGHWWVCEGGSAAWVLEGGEGRRALGEKLRGWGAGEEALGWAMRGHGEWEGALE